MLAPRSRLAFTSLALSLGGIVLQAIPVQAIEPIGYIKETAGVSSAGGGPCPLEPNLTGDCGNLKWYNLCAGYIWIFSIGALDEAVGVRFDDPCIIPGNRLDRAITYWRNTVPGYGQTVDVLVDVDTQNDGCPDYVLASDLALDPGMRWNCTDLSGACIPEDAAAIIVRGRTDGGSVPTFPTDGPFTQNCDPIGSLHSYYYGVNGSACVGWIGPTGRYDNFLYWLIVDSGCEPTPTHSATWGEVKGLYR